MPVHLDMVHVHRMLAPVPGKGAAADDLISDGVATTGLADGEYTNCETVLVRNGQSRSPEELDKRHLSMAGCVRCGSAAGWTLRWPITRLVLGLRLGTQPANRPDLPEHSWNRADR